MGDGTRVSEERPIEISLPGVPFAKIEIGNLNGHNINLLAFSVLTDMLLEFIHAFGQEMAKVMRGIYELSASASRFLEGGLSFLANKVESVVQFTLNFEQGDNEDVNQTLYTSVFLNNLRGTTQKEGRNTGEQLLKGQRQEGTHNEVDTEQAYKDEKRMAIALHGEQISAEELKKHFTPQQDTNIKALTSQSIAADITIALNKKTNSQAYNSPTRMIFDIQKVKQKEQEYIKISANMILAKITLDEETGAKLYQDNLEFTRNYYLSASDADTNWVEQKDKTIDSLQVIDLYSPVDLRKADILSRYEGVTGKEKAEIRDNNTISVTKEEEVKSYTTG